MNAGPSRWPLRQRILAAVLGRLSRWFGIKFFDLFMRPLASEQELAAAGPPPGYTFTRLSEADLARFSDDPQLELPADFLREAAKRGDVCFGVLHGSSLVAYRWYGLSGSTPAEPGFHFHYAHPGRAYGYKAFTLPAYRGKRLQLHSVNHSDAFLLDKGYTHTVGYIDERNFASLRMNSRIQGVRSIGRAVTVSVLGRRLAVNSRRAVRHGVGMATRP